MTIRRCPRSPLSAQYSESLNLTLNLPPRWHLRSYNHLKAKSAVKRQSLSHLNPHLHLRWHLHPHNRLGTNGAVKSKSVSHRRLRSYQGRLGGMPSRSTRGARCVDQINIRKVVFGPFPIVLIVSLRIMDPLI